MRAYGSHDTRQKMMAERFRLPPTTVLEIEKEEYITMQQIIAKNYARAGEMKMAKLPPCVKCSPEVLHYCEATGHECLKFQIYTSGE